MNFKSWLNENIQSYLSWLPEISPMDMSHWDGDFPFTYSAFYDELNVGKFQKYHADITTALWKSNPAKGKDALAVREGQADGISGRVAWGPRKPIFMSKGQILDIPGLVDIPDGIPSDVIFVRFYDDKKSFKPQFAKRATQLLLTQKFIKPNAVVCFSGQIFLAGQL